MWWTGYPMKRGTFGRYPVLKLYPLLGRKCKEVGVAIHGLFGAR
jgi:hypothetical protein